MDSYISYLFAVVVIVTVESVLLLWACSVINRQRDELIHQDKKLNDYKSYR